MNINEIPSSNAPVGALEALEQLEGWNDWGRERWIAAALGMAAKAGERLSRTPEAAEKILATLSPAGDSLYVALCLAARCGSVAQMQRFIDLGANPLRPYEEIKAANEKAREAAKREDAIGPCTPVGMPLWEAIEAGRHRAALWLIEQGVEPAPNAFAKALLSVLKWQGPGESDTDRERLREWLAPRMEPAQQEDWANGACVAIANVWEQGYRMGGRPGETEEEARREQERKNRANKTVLGWTRRAIEWGSTINPAPEEMATPMGLAIYADSLAMVQEFFNLGARFEDARLGKRNSLPAEITKAGFGPGMSLLLAFAQPPVLEWAFAHGMAPESEEEWDRVASVMRETLRPSSSAREIDRVQWIEAHIERRRLQGVVSSVSASAAIAKEGESGVADAAETRPSGAHRL